MRLNFENVDTIQNPADLFCGEFKVAGAARRPRETILFKSLLPERKTSPVPIQNFESVPDTVGEDEYLILKRGQPHLALDNCSQTVYLFAEVDMRLVNIYL